MGRVISKKCNFGTDGSWPEEAKEITTNSLTTIRRRLSAMETRTFLHGGAEFIARLFLQKRATDPRLRPTRAKSGLSTAALRTGAWCAVARLVRGRRASCARVRPPRARADVS